MAKEPEMLNGLEQERIAEAVFRLLGDCPALPEGVVLKYGDMASNCIGLHCLQGAVVTKRYVNGTFNAQIPFLLLYRSSPTTNADRIEREYCLNKVAQWLCREEITAKGQSFRLQAYPALTDGRIIERIEQTTTVSLAGRLESGESDYQVRVVLKYMKKGN